MRQLKDIVGDLLASRQLSQKWLADACGVAEPTISRAVKGLSTPGTDLVCRMADAFGVSVDYLLGRTADPVMNSRKENVEYIVGRAFMRCDARDRKIILAVLDDYMTGSESNSVYGKE